MEKLQIVNLKKSNHVRITGVSITRNSQNYRHISVGKKLKNEIFWKAIELYDNPEGHNMIEREQLKGLFSFVLSIEKRGVEESFSEGMINLLKIRGFNSLKELINTL